MNFLYQEQGYCVSSRPIYDFQDLRIYVIALLYLHFGTQIDDPNYVLRYYMKYTLPKETKHTLIIFCLEFSFHEIL